MKDGRVVFRFRFPALDPTDDGDDMPRMKSLGEAEPYRITLSDEGTGFRKVDSLVVSWSMWTTRGVYDKLTAP